MCGIVGYIGKGDGVPVVLEGLRRLEYRGYDSAGVAVVTDNTLEVHKQSGRVGDLANTLPEQIQGSPTIGHTRWATHGEPNDTNAHPHTDTSGNVAVVHNGIFENASEVKGRLQSQGVEFRSETDTEILAHLVARNLADDGDLTRAVRRSLKELVGAYGVAVMSKDHPDRIVVARNGSPLVLGLGDDEMYVGSDPTAFARHTRQVVHLDDGDVATITADGYQVLTYDAREAHREAREVPVEELTAEVDGHPDFMHKEIFEQPASLERTLSGRLDTRFATAHLGGLNLTPRELRDFKRVRILGCGSAYYAGEAGAQLIEALARIPASAEPASEFRYRNPVIEEDTLYIAVSQSGETADTLAAVHELRRKGGTVLGVVNAVGSSIARAVTGGIYLHAGPEVSVASTKAYTSMSAAFTLLAVQLGRTRDLSETEGRRIVEGLRQLPGQIGEILDLEEKIAEIAHRYSQHENLMFIGRVRGWPVAREGAQKLKEVSYLHAEAYPASELKHGPLALISPEMPTVAIVPDDELYEKNLSTLQEIKARGGPILAIAHRTLPGDVADDTIVIPRSEKELDPLLLNIPLQILAYHAALHLGREVDRPRNLAKSVTVE